MPDLLTRLAQRFSRQHTRHSDSQAIAFHYDVSNAFYALWLDAERVYSCAYFETPDDTLTRHSGPSSSNCRKLRLQRGERLLDIGCGWARWFAGRQAPQRARPRHHTQQGQHDFAQQRIANEGLQACDGRVARLRTCKARRYDKVASIGMFEHVVWPTSDLPGGRPARLRPGGLFLNHGITHDEEGLNRTVATEFITASVPDGEFDCVSNIQLGMERAGFEIQDVEPCGGTTR